MRKKEKREKERGRKSESKLIQLHKDHNTTGTLKEGFVDGIATWRKNDSARRSLAEGRLRTASVVSSC